MNRAHIASIKKLMAKMATVAIIETGFTLLGYRSNALALRRAVTERRTKRRRQTQPRPAHR
jgi:hypothetical protein